ncbi:JM28 [macacine gammaherpesvirus 11]|uniref:JM28 n=2 Tax=macacine gammaherpesvirus 11 TaxID=2560570 RepID=G9JM36_9GAMA|nr:JM28 [Macaca fuscata rhadinovirus]AAT00005.1 JM28 [Macaca fuscata rhadinovirus]AEW87553.1 JM28 [Macaca fuscata rhadinovirus]AEW87723.1 JM28 [Macaca fuscata rhadinovirus]
MAAIQGPPPLPEEENENSLPDDVYAIEGIFLYCGLGQAEYLHHPVFSPIKEFISSFLKDSARLYERLLRHTDYRSLRGLNAIGQGMLHINTDGRHNWGRALAVLGLGAYVVDKIRDDERLLTFAIAVLPVYAYEALESQWFRSHGGWEGLRNYCERILRHRRNARRHMCYGVAAGLLALVALFAIRR